MNGVKVEGTVGDQRASSPAASNGEHKKRKKKSSSRNRGRCYRGRKGGTKLFCLSWETDTLTVHKTIHVNTRFTSSSAGVMFFVFFLQAPDILVAIHSWKESRRWSDVCHLKVKPQQWKHSLRSTRTWYSALIQNLLSSTQIQFR